MANGPTVQGNASHIGTPTLIPHSRLFDAAFQDALNQLSTATGWGPGQYTVNVEFQAQITVTNPGRVDGYIVNIT